MIKNIIKQLCLWITVALPVLAYAETGYVIDTFKIGLHQNKTADSTIIKELPSGTPLEILNRDNDLTYVKDPAGNTGWINNRYLTTTPPAQTLLPEVRTKVTRLEAELAAAKLRITELESNNPAQNVDSSSNDPANALTALHKENAKLEQLNKSERLKVGELQAKLAELRNQMSQFTTDAVMAEKIKQLNEEKSQLEGKLFAAQAATSDSDEGNLINIHQQNWRNILIYISIALLLGIALGAFLLDVMNRRRHGGFRV